MKSSDVALAAQFLERIRQIEIALLVPRTLEAGKIVLTVPKEFVVKLLEDERALARAQLEKLGIEIEPFKPKPKKDWEGDDFS